VLHKTLIALRNIHKSFAWLVLTALLASVIVPIAPVQAAPPHTAPAAIAQTMDSQVTSVAAPVAQAEQTLNSMSWNA
jgi:hypothetical protein